jgi:prevent-host-death family protein
MRQMMKTVSAREANQKFSELLSRVESGEEILITKRSKPIALLSPFRAPLLTKERQQAINHAVRAMANGLPWGRQQKFKRDEMHER